MPKHEFYADPTLFDQWQNSAGNWLYAWGDKVRPYAWVVAFAGLGAVLASISMIFIGISLREAAVDITPAWNQSLARGGASVVALATVQWLFRQALDAWPRDVDLPRRVRRAARFVGWRPVAGAKRADQGTLKQPPKSPAAAVDPEAMRAFFAGVRAAGVNVAIARALFAAGVRSPRQLLAASDDDLVAIRGVGPATVRKLRTQFG
jgi:hypothetical protein